MLPRTPVRPDANPSGETAPALVLAPRHQDQELAGRGGLVDQGRMLVVALQTATGEAAERLRRRYPRSRLPKPVVVVVVALFSIAALGWLVWAAAFHSDVPVSGQVTSYTVVSDREVAFTLSVDRPDPSRAAVCTVVAKATDYEAVGVLDDIEVPPRAERVVDVKMTVRTLRRATNASLRSCSLR